MSDGVSENASGGGNDGGEPTIEMIATSAPAPVSTPAPFSPPNAPTASRGKGGIVAGTVLGLALLGGGGAFAYTQLVQEKSNTPVQAVESFYTSLANADALGLAETLEPGERDVFLDSVVPMVAEMNRLQVFDNADLKKVQGVSGSLTGFQASQKIVRSDLAEVTISSGTLTTNFDPKKLPFGKSLKDALGSVLDDAKTSSNTTKLGNPDSPFVVHKTGKRWYVSLNYSVAEGARRSTNESRGQQAFALPLRTGGVAAQGAKSPEEAVSAMMTAMADLDVERMVSLVPPDELPALQNYAGLWIKDAKANAAKASKNFDLNVRPKLRTQKIDDNRASVFVTDLPMDLKAKSDDFDLAVNYAAGKGDAKLTVGEEVSVDGTYAKGVLNGRLVATSVGKATIKVAKRDVSGTYDGTDGSKVRFHLDPKRNVTGSMDMADGTTGKLQLTNGDLQANFSAPDGTTGSVSSKGPTAKLALTFPDGSVSGFALADECLTVTTNGEEEPKKCGREEFASTFLGAIPVESQSALTPLLDRFFPSSKVARPATTSCRRTRPQPQIGFTTIKRNGAWFVSPTRTMLDAITASMKTLEPGDFDCYRTQFDALRDNLVQSMTARLNAASSLSDSFPAVTDSEASLGSFDVSDPSVPATELTDEELEKLFKELDAANSEAAAIDTSVPSSTP
jgi:hypothetical protein